VLRCGALKARALDKLLRPALAALAFHLVAFVGTG
jgi:hypothetical protein